MLSEKRAGRVGVNELKTGEGECSNEGREKKREE